MADAHDSKSCEIYLMRVRLSPRAPKNKERKLKKSKNFASQEIFS